jgi:23S rRNA (cytidine2498-2'-O)-methyltransferase
MPLELKSKFENSHFLFATCQVGAEPALKREIDREHKDLKFAFSRPGFLTFKKSEGEVALDSSIRSVFARTFGLSKGQVKSSEFSKLTDFLRELFNQNQNRKVRLHVWERDLFAPGEEPLGFNPGVLSKELEGRIRQECSELIEPTVKAQIGDCVLDVIIIEKDQWWLGAHLHSMDHSPFPGARAPLSLPAMAPSRAFLKLEEVLEWSHAPIKKGDIAVEIGSAPGGASYALLERGLKVVGIDPGEMAPHLVKNPNFRHIQSPVGQVLREDLPDSIQWLLLDMNVEPRISLFAVDRLASRMSNSLLGLILTVKLNDWKIADQIPDMLAHVRAMGMTRVKAAQLANHRQEIAIYGLTRKGTTRNK